MENYVHQENNRFHHWELALLLAVGLSLLAGTWLSGQQSALSGRVVRLHVIGASDSAEDQAVKLQVRDAVLQAAEPLLEGVEESQEAGEVLISHLEDLAHAGAEVAGVPVTAEWEEDAWFPTKRYTDFTLPGGRYTALKVTVGAGAGRNWWCVVFPPLCMGAVTEEAVSEVGGFTGGQVALVTGGEEGYEVRMKALEIWNRLTDRLK